MRFLSTTRLLPFVCGLLLTFVGARNAVAQPGVTEPIIVQALDGWHYGLNPPTRSVDNYVLEIEQVTRNSPVAVIMWSTDASSNGALVFPSRYQSLSKTELHYNAIEWRNAPPNTTYSVLAIIFWNAGTGAISGNHYNGGFKIVSIPVTVSP